MVAVTVIPGPGCRTGPGNPAGHLPRPSGNDIRFTLMSREQHQSEPDAVTCGDRAGGGRPGRDQT